VSPSSSSSSSPPPSPSWQSWKPLCVNGEADLRSSSSDFCFRGSQFESLPWLKALLVSLSHSNSGIVFQVRPRPLTSVLFPICYPSIILLFEVILLDWKIRHSIPSRGERVSSTPKRSDRFWGPYSLIFNGYQYQSTHMCVCVLVMILQ
jgi:hypothetical protein